MDGPAPVSVKQPTTFEIVETGEQILKDSGAKIFHDQADRAFYNRQFDTIHLPPRAAFPSAEAYYGTSIHELVHWTGHASRLNHETLNKSRGFSTANEYYSREELVAEIGSMMLAAEKGIPHDPTQHAAYVSSWIKALKRGQKRNLSRRVCRVCCSRLRPGAHPEAGDRKTGACRHGCRPVAGRYARTPSRSCALNAEGRTHYLWITGIALTMFRMAIQMTSLQPANCGNLYSVNAPGG